MTLPRNDLPEQEDTDTRTDWYGDWPGVVVDTADPERLGRRFPQYRLYPPWGRECLPRRRWMDR